MTQRDPISDIEFHDRETRDEPTTLLYHRPLSALAGKARKVLRGTTPQGWSDNQVRYYQYGE